jgi:hypothetical protein|tara:strand:+ start:308 stop:607 length:300 start_codon:yes stop_codon:yes gene_type:complete
LKVDSLFSCFNVSYNNASAAPEYNAIARPQIILPKKKTQNMGYREYKNTAIQTKKLDKIKDNFLPYLSAIAPVGISKRKSAITKIDSSNITWKRVTLPT